MWVLSAEAVQIAMGARDTDHQNDTYEKPYFVTYVSLSAFSVCLLGFVRKSWRAALRLPPRLNPPFAPLRDAPHDETHCELQNTTQLPADDDGHVVVVPFNARQVLRIALVIAPLYFLSDWVFTIGLVITSVASSSTISSLTGLFTLIIGALMHVERFSTAKLLASFVTIAGVAVIATYDGKQEGTESVLGDIVNILAAVIYSIYTTVLKYKSGPPGALDVSMLFGMIGFVVLVAAPPGLVLLHFLGWETFQLPSKRIALVLFVNAWIGTVVADFLWAKSIVLTTPMIGTLTLSLTLPLSIILDYFFRGVEFSVPYLIGVTLVFTGFVAVNVDEMLERSRRKGAELENCVAQHEEG